MGFDVSVDDVYQARDRVHQTGLSTKDYPTPEQMEHYWLVYFKCLLKELAITNKLEQCTIRLKEEFRYYSGTYLYPEVPYVLSTLKARGHAVGMGEGDHPHGVRAVVPASECVVTNAWA